MSYRGNREKTDKQKINKQT